MSMMVALNIARNVQDLVAAFFTGGNTVTIVGNIIKMLIVILKGR